LDEPFASLDAGLRAQARAEVKRLVASYEVATILVTHDQEEALAFADRIGIISAGQLVQEGSPRQVYREPKSAFVAGFLGGANLVKARAHGLAADSPLGEIRLQSYAEGFVELALRPEHLRLQPDPAGAARVLSREFYGHDLSYRVQLAGEVYQVKTGYATWLEPGTSVNLLVAEPAAVLAESAL
jgi:iron(III) transport system ATP-binding protein